MTLGSLFDGIGGFPLAAIRHGITPVWASEIEPIPISITKRHFPDMEHLGDATKINGAEITPVDIITFGSPCQDLSNAGLRAGLDGSRSGLFFDAVRIIKQMRENTNGNYPKRIIWENVPGTFSSTEGKDFLIVLREIASIAESGISIPEPPHKFEEPIGWLAAGAIVGDGYSLAWRTLDAQYWGVPQRRQRIFLIADFRSECAGEILFKSEGVPRHFEQGEKKGKGIAGNIEDCAKAAGFNGWRSVMGTLEYAEERAPCIQTNMPPNAVIGVDGYNQNLTGDKAQTIRGGRSDGDNVGMVILNDQGGSNINVEKSDISPCLRSETHGNLPIVCLENHPTGGLIKIIDGKVQTLTSRMGTGGGNMPMIMAVHQNQCGEVRVGDVANTLNTNSNPSGRNAPLIAFRCKSIGGYKQDNKSKSLMRCDDVTTDDLITENYRVRRLTPLECERLQGFPDGWTEYGYDNKPISDSARYKALGNSVAIPCVEFLMSRIKEILEENQE